MLSKNLPITLALGLALATLEVGAAAPKSVMDYYQEVPTSLFPSETKYELKQTKGGWITHSMDTEAEISATVDTKNGFIQFIDEGTGGGDVKTQVALFLKEDKSPLVAISTSMFDGMASTGRIALVEPDGGKWKAVTSTAIPALRLADFLDSKCLAALREDVRGMLEKEGIRFTLPRQGTTVHASVMLTPSMLEGVGDEASAKANSPCPTGDVSRELKWDKKAGRFTLDAAKPKGSAASKK
ncbi:hypothetical protein [Archangium lansingense]|uniref:Uncharacterized protein n=1 Tax=Archangium lansingense TaxID=2995310 RepID=A0ABT4A9U0_9BACT|nr:hypothetical protein [Archangium lansinium]MCY1078111.1 hypothetical protein [Archangium lansinium]